LSIAIFLSAIRVRILSCLLYVWSSAVYVKGFRAIAVCRVERRKLPVRTLPCLLCIIVFFLSN